MLLACGFSIMGGFKIWLSRQRLWFTTLGILSAGQFIPWSKIRWYEWKDGTNPTLTFETSSKLPFLNRGALPIPEEHRDSIDALLNEQGVTSKA